jgi:hypothetical protein
MKASYDTLWLYVQAKNGLQVYCGEFNEQADDGVCSKAGNIGTKHRLSDWSGSQLCLNKHRDSRPGERPCMTER